MSGAAEAAAMASAAGRLIDAGNISGAERLLKQALAADPESARAHALMALVLYQGGKWPAAVRQADVSLGLEPTADAFRFKSLALLKLRQYGRAIEAAQAGVRTAPSLGMPAFALAVALENAGRFAEAQAQFRRAVELDPGSEAFRADLGRFLLRRGDVAGAEQIAAGLPPGADSVGALLLRGELALLRGRPGEARDFALWVLARDAVSQPALRLLVQVKASQSRLMGLWWRYTMFLARKPVWMRLLLVALIILLPVLGLQVVGLLFIVYVYACGQIFARMVARELKGVSLRKSF
ncbi:MAG TPA: tetratricopeptide repeat protein [Caulobacteraceae bacterium]|jgi:Flp pilus assembly protein TadD|nr:tetratricopeptide repeat protein [Caulobacteraceae bacterium]